MDITATCAEITVTFPGGSASFNKEITTTEIVVAQNPESEDRVYLNQNSANAPLTFWWNLNKAIEFGYNTLQELYDYFVAEIANQCGGGGNSSITISENGIPKGTTSNVDFVDGTNTTVDVVKDNVSGKVKVKVNALGGDPYPNGVVMVNASRDFEAADANKILFCTAPNIELTMPAISPFAVLDKFYIYPDVNTKYNIQNGTDFIEIFTSPLGQGELTEILFTGATLTSINGFIVEGGNIKSTLKYLYDKVNRVVPDYIDDAAADADINLLSGQTYTLTGSRVLNIKP